MLSQSLERTQQDSHGSYLSVTCADALGKKEENQSCFRPKAQHFNHPKSICRL